MFPLIGAVVAGALLMGRSKPKTKCEKKAMLGPHSGNSYTVEDFPAAGFIVVKAVDGSTGVFSRRSLQHPGAPGYIWHHGQGKPRTMQLMMRDFTIVLPTPKPTPGATAQGGHSAGNNQ